MCLKVLLFLVIIVFSKQVLWHVVATAAEAVSCKHHKFSSLFKSANITSFMDENRYIRLNISWEEPLIVNLTVFDMTIDTNCSALYGERNVSVDKHFIIQPNMDRLKHPAEPLIHGCYYNVEFYTEVEIQDETCLVLQSLSYEIPRCVDEVCECGIAKSPFELQEFRQIRDNLYKANFRKTHRETSVNLESVFDIIWYANEKDNKTVSVVHPEDVAFFNDDFEFTVPFSDFHKGNTYTINVQLMLDNCDYHFTTKIAIPSEQSLIHNKYHYGVYTSILFLFCVALLACLFLRSSQRCMEKFSKYVPYLQELPPTAVDVTLSSVTKEVVNSQYTPLEFLVNAHKFDNYEIPRNKIAFEDEIGGGAFGKVYRADLHQLDNNKPGYRVVAAKKPIDNAPPEEICDFLAEIEIMKKIADHGGHQNVVRILACVTMEPPYVMVMDLLACGSLKSYLLNLRKQWDQRRQRLRLQQNERRFFPDNMVVEHYLSQTSGLQGTDGECQKLKYSDLAFRNYTDTSVTNSYITPETPTTPSSPGSPSQPISPKFHEKSRPSIAFKRTNNLSYSPDSIESTGLPSVTETLMTPLESDTSSPLISAKKADKDETKINPVLDSKELNNFAMQIANGMAFLESIEVTHRDLAARNILIGENNILKISDFGMARVGVYVNTAQKRQPLRWMAPEAIESRRCDNKTDVWSFGVVLWEMGSLGGFPYKNLTNESVIAYVLQGKRLERPETCTDQVYDLMQKCWAKNPDERPTFRDIAERLAVTSGKIYVDFSRISPEYVFPAPEQSVRN